LTSLFLDDALFGAEVVEIVADFEQVTVGYVFRMKVFFVVYDFVRLQFDADAFLGVPSVDFDFFPIGDFGLGADVLGHLVKDGLELVDFEAHEPSVGYFLSVFVHECPRYLVFLEGFLSRGRFVGVAFGAGEVVVGYAIFFFRKLQVPGFEAIQGRAEEVLVVAVVGAVAQVNFLGLGDAQHQSEQGHYRQNQDSSHRFLSV